MIRVYALFALVPLFSSLSPAQHWQWQNPLPRGNTVNAIVMLDQTRGVAVCDDGIMLWSADGGTTWGSFKIATVDLHDIVRMGDGTLLIAADRRRILRSSDDGYSWTMTWEGISFAAGYSSAISRVDDASAVAFLNGAELIKTTDYGQSWQKITSLTLFSENIRSISIQSPRTWWMVTSRNTYVTNDAGETWLNANLAYSARGLQRFVYSDSLKGYQCREGQLLRTMDGGATWEEMNIFGFGVVMDVAVGPALGDDVYCLSTGRYLVNKSPDGGATWNISLTETAFADASVSAMAFVDGDLGFLVGDGGRILRTEDGGQSWSIVHGHGYIGTIANIHFFDALNGIALTYSPTALLTTNGGARWDEFIPSQTHTLRFLSVSPEGTAFAVGVSGFYEYQLYRSTTKGRSWEAVSDRIPIDYSPFNQLIPQSLLAISDQELLLGVSYAHLYRSTNGGLSWDSTLVPTPGINPFLSGTDMAFFPPSTVFYSLYNAIAFSTDKGATWDLREDPSGAAMYRTRFLSEQIGFSIIQGRMSSTTDGGRNWKRISELNTELYHFFDPMNGIMLWSDSNDDDRAWLYTTADGGQNWGRLSLGGQVYWNDWFFIDRNLGWAISYGGLIQQTTSGGLVSVDATPTPTSGVQLGNAWPNPFTPELHGNLRISYTLDREQMVRLSLVDMLGRERGVIVDGMHERGRHTAVVPSATNGDLVPGMYFLRLLTPTGIHTAPVLSR